ncbi:hypothetical protein CDCA_CDCA16G4236 [Cyanidium caldarium]|uniref:Uncharacterized protein n=1 Tax=Cyanidium caldarium TaxID=2771 RepID=A0AAV9J1Q6_CYACA|nr:hypothetical protein CDCA_CDCA16G4236 [Cyanidium caldarium]
MPALEKAVFLELQARVRANKYRPNPTERNVLKGCQARVGRNALLGGLAAGSLAFLLLPPARPGGSSLFQAARRAAARVGALQEAVARRASTGERTPLEKVRENARRAIEAQEADSKATPRRLRPFFLRRGFIAVVLTIAGARYAGQRTGARCLEDLLNLGHESAMANEIRLILADIANEDRLAEERLESDSIPYVDEATGTNPSLATESGDAAGDDLRQRPVSPLMPNTRRMVRGKVTRYEVETWLERHDHARQLASSGDYATSWEMPDGDRPGHDGWAEGGSSGGDVDGSDAEAAASAPPPDTFPSLDVGAGGPSWPRVGPSIRPKSVAETPTAPGRQQQRQPPLSAAGSPPAAEGALSPPPVSDAPTRRASSPPPWTQPTASGAESSSSSSSAAM